MLDISKETQLYFSWLLIFFTAENANHQVTDTQKHSTNNYINDTHKEIN